MLIPLAIHMRLPISDQ